MNDEKFMARVLSLAKKGAGYVSPNPMVGAVIVDKNGRIISEGYHKRYGDLHAERAALEKIDYKAEGCTLYVNLEPCCHYGKTPPCTEAIIKSGIKRVVIGMLDPNPSVNGKGVEILKKHKIEVNVGILEEKCRELNRFFIKWIKYKIPYVTLKWAESLDGRIATSTGDSKWISSEKSRKFAHKLRAEYDAVLVGKNTVIKDDPELTVRLVKGKNPVRVILDTHLNLDKGLKVFKTPPDTWLFTAEKRKEKIDTYERQGIKIFTVGKSNEWVSLKEVLKKLGENGITSLLVEGGQKIHTQFLKENLADEVLIVIAPIIIGKGKEAIGDLNIKSIKEAIKFEKFTFRRIERDILFSGKLKIY